MSQFKTDPVKKPKNIFLVRTIQVGPTIIDAICGYIKTRKIKYIKSGLNNKLDIKQEPWMNKKYHKQTNKCACMEWNESEALIPICKQKRRLLYELSY